MDSFLKELQSKTIKNTRGCCANYSRAIATTYYMFMTNHPDTSSYIKGLKRIDDACDTINLKSSDLTGTQTGSFNRDYVLVDFKEPLVSNAQLIMKINYKDNHWWCSSPDNKINFQSENKTSLPTNV